MVEEIGLTLARLFQLVFGALVLLLCWVFRQQHGRIGDLEARVTAEAKARQDAKDSISQQITEHAEASAAGFTAMRRELGEDVRRIHEKMDSNHQTIMSYLLTHKSPGG